MSSRTAAGTVRSALAEVAKALAHEHRVELIEQLAQGPRNVEALAERVGLSLANASQHLAVLRSRQIVIGRKDGNQVFYSLRSPLLGKVLDLMRQYFHEHLNESLAMLRDMESEGRSSKKTGRSRDSG